MKLFLNFEREFSIYKTLKRLAEQRIAVILQPGNIWVIEKSLPEDDVTDENLRTCYLRGWVEPIEKAIPKGRLKSDGSLPDGQMFQNVGPIYRMTDSGWNAIHRTHVLTLLGIIISLLAVLIAIIH